MINTSTETCAQLIDRLTKLNERMYELTGESITFYSTRDVELMRSLNNPTKNSKIEKNDLSPEKLHQEYSNVINEIVTAINNNNYGITITYYPQCPTDTTKHDHWAV